MSIEKAKKPYRSCYYLESGMSFLINGIAFCCDKPSPAIIQPMADAGKTVGAFLEARERVIRENQGNDPPPCIGCNLFQECEPTGGEINYINFGVHRFCQFSCTYCMLQHAYAQDKNRPEAYDSLEITEELKRRGLLSKTLEIVCGPGEITVHPKKDRYYDFIEENAGSVLFASNAGKFDPRLAHILSLSPRNSMTVSIDCGTEDMFRKIRGVDMFQHVIVNLAEYRKYSPNIILKYILLGENCGDDDLNGFIQLCSKLKPLQIVIAGNTEKIWNWGGQLNCWDISLREEHIVNAAIKLVEGAQKYNIDFSFQDNLGQANLREIRRRLAAYSEIVPAQGDSERANLQKIFNKFAASPEVVSAEQQLDTVLSAPKVVCYGAGINCRNVLSQIKSLGLRKPDVIWDIKAGSGQMLSASGCEYTMRHPDFEQLDNSTDGVFITITDNAINQKLVQTMKAHGFSNLLTHDQLMLALMAKRAKMPL